MTARTVGVRTGVDVMDSSPHTCIVVRRRGGEKGQGPRYAPCPRRDRKHSPHHHGPLRRSQRPCRSGVTMTLGFGCADLNGDPAVHPFGCLSGRLYGGTGHVYASWKPWRRRTPPLVEPVDSWTGSMSRLGRTCPDAGRWTSIEHDDGS